MTTDRFTDENIPDSPAQTDDPLAGFPIVTRDTIRYGDTDRQGHVNNAVYGSYFETGRVRALDRAQQVLAGTDDFEIVLASITIDYIQEITWPGEAVVGTRVTKVGNTSVTFEQVIVVDGTLRARARNVTVKVDPETHRPVPFTDQQREQFAALA